MLAPLSKRPVTPSVETPVASFSPTWRQRVYVDLLVDRLHRGQCTRDTSIAPFLGLRPEAISRWRQHAGFRAWLAADVRTRFVAALGTCPRLPPRSTRPPAHQRREAPPDADPRVPLAICL